jgi:hypothetical protein
MLVFFARMMVTVPLLPVRSNTIFPDKKYLKAQRSQVSNAQTARALSLSLALALYLAG